MLVRYVLLALPIHQRSFAAYYQAHDREVQARRVELEREWGGQPFDELPAHIRLAWKDRWYWPPWFLNDIAGFLKVGTADDALLGDVYLARRYFPPTAPERFNRLGSGAGAEGDGDDRDIIFLATVERRPIVAGDNASYVRACDEIIAEARETVRLQGHGLAEAEIWMPGFEIACFDLARADQQLRERFPGRTEPR
jgi:hypothetical protein